MRLLLDTHVLLWALAAPERIRDEARHAIIDGRNPVLVSAASAWEIAIKRGAGKLTAPDDLLDMITATGLTWLPITARHAEIAGALPTHHRDPFDRMLIAQAIAESLTIVTRDDRRGRYEVDVLEA